MMSQEFPKNNIDLDALVNDILNEKATDSPAPTSPQPDPVPTSPAGTGREAAREETFII